MIKIPLFELLTTSFHFETFFCAAYLATAAANSVGCILLFNWSPLLFFVTCFFTAGFFFATSVLLFFDWEDLATFFLLSAFLEEVLAVCFDSEEAFFAFAELDLAAPSLELLEATLLSAVDDSEMVLVVCWMF